MSHSKVLRFLFLLVVVLTATALPAAASTAGGPPPAQGVRLTPIGQPIWRPVDFHIFSAEMGTAATGYAEFVETALALMPEPNHALHDNLMVGPGAPHDPPYTAEMATGVAAQGFHEGVRFSQTEFTDGAGVWIAWITVPDPGATGSSPDFASGPIIPNTLFPIHVEGITTRNGQMFDPALVNTNVPPLTPALTPPFSVDGHSHFPMFIADSAEFGPGGKLRGSYTYQITMVDSSGNGWNIQAHFVIAP